MNGHVWCSGRGGIELLLQTAILRGVRADSGLWVELDRKGKIES
jgi:hypothetical protein